MRNARLSPFQPSIVVVSVYDWRIAKHTYSAPTVSDYQRSYFDVDERVGLMLI